MSTNTTVLSEISRVLNTPTSKLDLDASFIHNGGDSLSSVQLLIGLRRLGIHISFESIFTASSLCALANGALLHTSRSENSTATSVRRTGIKRLRSDIENAPPANNEGRRRIGSPITKKQQQDENSPMTEIQLSLIRSTQLHHGRNIISYQEEYDASIVPTVKKAWESILHLEPIFTMSFNIGDTAGYMQDDGKSHVAWNETIVFDEGAYRQAVEAKPRKVNIIGAEISVITLRSPKTQSTSTILYRFHHALIDGVSFSLLLSKVKSCLRGKPYDPGLPYSMFATQLRNLQNQKHDAAVRFWKARKKQYASAATQLLMPTFSDDERNDPTYTVELDINSNPNKLVQLARDLGVTVASLYYAAWGLVLSKYTDSHQVCFGVVLSGRTLPIEGVETVIGPTINTLPFFIDLSSSTSIGNLVANTFAEMLELTSCQWSTPVHGFHRDFDSAINVRFHGPNSTLVSPHDVVECPRGTVVSDIPIHIDVGTCGKLTLSYHAHRYARHHMECLASNFSNALEMILSTQNSLDECLTSLVCRDQLDELSKLGNSGSGISKHGNSDDTLVSLFKRGVRSWPGELALEWESGSMTYSELDKTSTRVAMSLAEHVRAGDVVCVDANRSVDWIVGIYAVLKVGATYFPLDQSVPRIIQDAYYKTAGAKLFLATRAISDSQIPASCSLVLSVEELSSARHTLDLSHVDLRPSSSAYVCFTSGSTGNPKGVLCRHDGLVAFQSDFNVRLCSQPGWKIAQFMSPCFDGSVHEIFSALNYGATLVLQNESRPFEHLKMADCAILTPSVAQVLEPSEHQCLRAVYLVGEAVPQVVCDHWADGRQLWNMYGPTEATCGATIQQLRRGEPVCLGLPNPSSRIYILDRRQCLVAPGVIGEIYLAGVQIATGYLALPEETSARFSPDHVHPEHVGEYMYKTGDRAYWSGSGKLMLLGRNDRQVKLHGFRIDLDDLEVRIVRAYDDCTAAAVAVDGDHLVAFVQPATLNLSALNASLKQDIPAYALPRRIRAVSIFPVTPAGKLDYKRVSMLEIIDEASQRRNVTRSEEKVLGCLREVFGRPSDGVNYLDLRIDDIGATSMALISLTHRLSDAFNQRITIRTVLDCDSIGNLAGALAGLGGSEDVSKAALPSDPEISPIERHWWQKYRVNGNTSTFNVSYACTFPATLENQKLALAWDTILSRYRILSCRYLDDENSRTYHERPPRARSVQQIDVSTEVNRPFDLGTQDLIRVFISRTAMLVVVSHIICDLTTLKILFKEVADVYHGRESTELAEGSIKPAWSVPASKTDLAFWSNFISCTSVPTYSVGNCIRRRKWTGSSYISQVPQYLHSSMRRFSSSIKCTMHQLVLGSMAVALQYKAEHCDITIGAPYLNRNSEDDMRAVGLFVEPLPIRIRYSPREQNPEPVPFIKSVQKFSRAALSHAIPWNQLLSHLGIETDYPNNPVFDVMVTFHDRDQEPEFPLDGVTSQPTWSEGSKFKIMAEFTASKNGSLSMRLEYSDECFSHADIKHMGQLIISALKGLTEELDYLEIVRRLNSLDLEQRTA